MALPDGSSMSTWSVKMWGWQWLSSKMAQLALLKVQPMFIRKIWRKRYTYLVKQEPLSLAELRLTILMYGILQTRMKVTAKTVACKRLQAMSMVMDTPRSTRT